MAGKPVDSAFDKDEQQRAVQRSQQPCAYRGSWKNAGVDTVARDCSSSRELPAVEDGFFAAKIVVGGAGATSDARGAIYRSWQIQVQLSGTR